MIASFLDAHLLSWVIFLPFAIAALLLFVSSSSAVLLRNKGLPHAVCFGYSGISRWLVWGGG